MTNHIGTPAPDTPRAGTTPGDPLLGLLRDQLAASSRERREQTEAFTGALKSNQVAHSADIAGLRSDVRYYARAAGGVFLLALLIIAAFGGVQVVRGVKPASIDLSAAAPVLTPAASAAE